MMMPDMDGPQTLARLRASPAAADIPVVFLTGQSASPSPEGAGSLFGFERLSSTASALEISIAAGDRGHGALDGVEAGLDALVDGIEHA
jgi:CheY-like chemotaxis protein